MNNVRQSQNLGEESAMNVNNLNFSYDKCSLLLNVDAEDLLTDTFESFAQINNLNKKEEFHITIIGRETGENILEMVSSLPVDDKKILLAKIDNLSREFDWSYTPNDEYYEISKKYDTADGEEIRRSLIQIIEIPDLKAFYENLNILLGTDFKLPLPHVTLFTTSSIETMRLRGIGLYSVEQFQSLSPNRIVVDNSNF